MTFVLLQYLLNRIMIIINNYLLKKKTLKILSRNLTNN